jgi:hypothetical protein
MIGLWDVDAFSGFRITSGPRRPGPHEEYSEALHFHSITSGQAATISSRSALTIFSTSFANRPGFCCAMREINSDLIIFGILGST